MGEKFKDLLEAGISPKNALDEEDLKLWRDVNKGTKPLKKPGRQGALPSQGKAPIKTRKESGFRDQGVSEGWDFEAIGPPGETSVSSKALLSGTRQARRLRRRAAPEATLDLHGMTQKEAYKTLCHFVHQAHLYGFKTLRIVTGKGRTAGPSRAFESERGEPVPQKGVLKKALPHWLEGPPLSLYVSHATPARQRDGGEGAWYLFLKSR